MATTARRTPAAEDIPVVGPRQPCPCGSGKRYKQCHGKVKRHALEYVARPFAGLANEADWIALREIVPAATATAKTTAEYGARDLTVVTVLPMAWAGVHTDDGRIAIALQTMSNSGDASRDAAAAVLDLLAAEPGTSLPNIDLGGGGPRLQDILDPDVPLTVTVEDGFDYWVGFAGADAEDVTASLAQVNEAAFPTRRLTSVDSAYWCRMNAKEFLRWVQPYDEDALLDALARLHGRHLDGAGDVLESSLGPDTRIIGAFRTCGVCIPVWDLAPGAEADEMEGPAQAFAARLAEALAVDEPLTVEERRARAGLVARQLTIR